MNLLNDLHLTKKDLPFLYVLLMVFKRNEDKN